MSVEQAITLTEKSHKAISIYLRKKPPIQMLS